MENPTTTTANSNNNNKRCRGDTFDTCAAEAKRHQTDLICILDDDDVAGTNDDTGPAAEDIAAIMNSLEEEMGLLSPPPPPLLMPQQQPDLGYLLEASDDELGLPPACSTEEYYSDIVVHNITGQVPGASMSGFDQMWGFDSEISCSFGDGLFEQQQQDFSDLLLWQSELLPTTTLL